MRKVTLNSTVCRARLAAAMALICAAAAAASADEQCFLPAEGFLETGEALILDDDETVLQIKIDAAGTYSPTFAFATGAGQVDIVLAINAFTHMTKVQATVSSENPDRVRLASIGSLPGGQLSLTQVAYDTPLLFESATSGKPSFNIVSHNSGGEPADFNCDGVVDVTDLLLLLDAWGACGWGEGATCPRDLNGDGVVDVSDLLLLLAAWS